MAVDLKMDEQMFAQTGSSNSEDDSFSLYQNSSSLSSSANSRRQRVTFDQEVKAMLFEFFSRCQYPDYTQRTELAEKAGVTESRIQVWFQNRRTRLRRKNHVINKPRNLPGPMVGTNGFRSPGLENGESPARPQPVACVVQPRPRGDNQVSSETVTHHKAGKSFKARQDVTSSASITNEMKRAFRLTHSMDHILKPVSARKQLDLSAVFTGSSEEGRYQSSSSSSSSSSVFSQSSHHVLEIAPIDSNELTSQQDEPLDLSLKTNKFNSDCPASPAMFASLPFPWLSVFPSGFSLNHMPPAAAAALLMKHSSSSP